MLRIPALLFLLVVLSGCRLAVIAVQGGEVQSIRSGTCLAGTVCVNEVTDTSYSESFTAVPDTGWNFVKWNPGENFLCEDSTNPVCAVSNTLVAGNPLAEAIVASDQTYFLMPVFVEVGVPITDTVTVDGTVWAQPDLFRISTWSAMNRVCPGGPCNGVLNGYDMTGWHWANVEQVNALFNFFGVEPALKGPDRVDEPDSTWAPALLRAGFRPTEINAYGAGQRFGVYGFVSELAPTGSARSGFVWDAEDPLSNDAVSTATTFFASGVPNPESRLGGWFFTTR